MAYNDKAEPTLLSALATKPVKLAGTTGLLLIENDIDKKGPRFLGALILKKSESPFDLVGVMDVTEIRRLSGHLWELANHLIKVRIDTEMAEQEKKKPKRKLRK